MLNVAIQTNTWHMTYVIIYVIICSYLSYLFISDHFPTFFWAPLHHHPRKLPGTATEASSWWRKPAVDRPVRPMTPWPFSSSLLGVQGPFFDENSLGSNEARRLGASSSFSIKLDTTWFKKAVGTHALEPELESSFWFATNYAICYTRICKNSILDSKIHLYTLLHII